MPTEHITFRALTLIGVSVFCAGIVNTNIGQSNRNRPANLSDSGFKPDPPGMDALEAGQRVLAGM